MVGMRRKLKEENGSILVIGLLILGILTVIGISASRTAEIDIQIAGNERLHKTAFYAADAGIEVGRAVLNDLKAVDSGTWDNLLNGTTFTWNDGNVSTLDEIIDAGGGRSVGAATYALAIRDNDDLDGSTQVDTDNIVILTSTGTYRDATVQIEATVRYTGGGDQYAQEHYDADSTGEAAREDADVANNQRW
jgi:Tfp pilus assembly protein PilX